MTHPIEQAEFCAAIVNLKLGGCQWEIKKAKGRF